MGLCHRRPGRHRIEGPGSPWRATCTPERDLGPGADPDGEVGACNAAVPFVIASACEDPVAAAKARSKLPMMPEPSLIDVRPWVANQPARRATSADS